MVKKTLYVLLSIIAVSVILILILMGCAQEIEIGEIVNAFSGKDSTAPVLLSVSMESSLIVRLEFSEPVKIYGSSFGQGTARADGKLIFVSLNSSLPPGKKSTVSGRVKDYSGNTSGFSVQVWGFNPNLPKILINEFTSKGTEKSPDRTELKVLSRGNLNGMTLYNGTPNDWDSLLILPDMEVREGDYVVIWWTASLPDGQSEEPGGGVHNICAKTDGLSSNNGGLVLCDNPSAGAHITDAVLYSNFSTSNSGFGTKTALERANWILKTGRWNGDAVDSTASTATRSMSRKENIDDTDTCKDWFITVTGGSTFGSANSSQEF